MKINLLYYDKYGQRRRENSFKHLRKDKAEQLNRFLNDELTNNRLYRVENQIELHTPEVITKAVKSKMYDGYFDTSNIPKKFNLNWELFRLNNRAIESNRRWYYLKDGIVYDYITRISTGVGLEHLVVRRITGTEIVEERRVIEATIEPIEYDNTKIFFHNKLLNLVYEFNRKFRPDKDYSKVSRSRSKHLRYKEIYNGTKATHLN